MKKKGPQVPRILLYDIENAYLIGAAWEVHQVDIFEVLQQPYILSIAYKWLGEEKTHIISIPQFHGYQTRGQWGYLPEQEEEVVTAFHKVMGEADHLLGHNSDNFDYKKLNTTFIKYNLPPPKPTKNIDTLKALRKIGKFPSNRLDDVCGVLGIGRKLPHTGKHLWTACMRGDKAAWKMMEAYNKHDVDPLLEGLYYRIRPFITNHPNLAIVTRELQTCPKCGSGEYWKSGFVYTMTGEAQRYKCKNCFGWYQGKMEKLASKIVNR